MSFDTLLIQESFRVIRPRSAEFAALFYQRFFALAPDVRPLFAHMDMQHQHPAFMLSLLAVVDNLSDTGGLKKMVHALGQRHVTYQATPEYYALAGEALLTSLATMLGPSWTPAHRTAWRQAYTLLVDLMLDKPAP